MGTDPRREVGGEQRQVLQPLAQRREVNRKDIQPEVEILAEEALAAIASSSRRLVAAITRTSTRTVRLAAHPLDLARLQHPEQLGLGLEAQVADLVEQEGAAVGQLEAARSAGRWHR